MGRQQAPRSPASRCHTGRLAALVLTLGGLFAISCMAISCTAIIDGELNGKGNPPDAGTGGVGGTSPSGPSGPGGGPGGGPVTSAGGQDTTTSTSTGGAECNSLFDCHFAHAVPTCDKGVCKIQKCLTPFADCNGDDMDGCEIDLAHDDEHCSKCDKDCTQEDNKSCEEGKCK